MSSNVKSSPRRAAHIWFHTSGSAHLDLQAPTTSGRQYFPLLLPMILFLECYLLPLQNIYRWCEREIYDWNRNISTSWGKWKVCDILQVQKLCSKSHSNTGNKLYWPRVCWRLAQSELLVPRKSVQSIQLHQPWALCAKTPWLVISIWFFLPNSPNTKTAQGAIPTKWLQSCKHTTSAPLTVIGNPAPFKTVSAAIQELLYPYLVPNSFMWLIQNLTGTWGVFQSGLKK